MSIHTYFGLCFCEQKKWVDPVGIIDIISDKFEIMNDNDEYVAGKFSDIKGDEPTTFRYRICKTLIPVNHDSCYEFINGRYYMEISYENQEDLDEQLHDYLENESFTHAADKCIMFGAPNGMHHMFYMVSYKGDEPDPCAREISNSTLENFFNLVETFEEYEGYCKLGYRSNNF